MEIHSNNLRYYSQSGIRVSSASNIGLHLEKLKSEIVGTEILEILRFIDSLLQFKYAFQNIEKNQDTAEWHFKYYVDFSLYSNKKLINLARKIFKIKWCDIEENVVLHIIFGIWCWVFRDNIRPLFRILIRIDVFNTGFVIPNSFDDISDDLRLYLHKFYA